MDFFVIRLVQFPSRQAYDNAIRMIAKKGRLFKLERVMLPCHDALIRCNCCLPILWCSVLMIGL